ncbi:hypothetical protein [Aliivibrio fischeri]|uniref:hypothetical protein n=1 Tax=Aliivibrio fischeri TaxID=668 RepID=UPI0007C48ED1|nr:hypothetical protein [Aliivibrio fischeri]
MFYTDFEIALILALFVAALLCLGHFIPKNFTRLSNFSISVLKFYLYMKAGLVNRKGELIGKAKIEEKRRYAQVKAPVKVSATTKPLNMAVKNKVVNEDLSTPAFLRKGKEVELTDSGYCWKGKKTFSNAINQNLNLAQA